MKITQSATGVRFATSTNADPDASAMLELEGVTQGFLPNRVTTTERDAIATPSEGLVIYNLTTHKLNVYTTEWEEITSAGPE